MAQLGDIEVCGLVVRPHEHVVLVAGHEVALTAREFEIAVQLAGHPGWVFSADQLSKESEEGDYSPESVSVHVSRLRHKLARAGAPEAIETVRGAGYRLRASVADQDELPGVAAKLTRVLRDAAWQLQEAVLEVEHSGTAEQQGAAVDALEQARRSIYTSLAK